MKRPMIDLYRQILRDINFERRRRNDGKNEKRSPSRFVSSRLALLVRSSSRDEASELLRVDEGSTLTAALSLKFEYSI